MPCTARGPIPHFALSFIRTVTVGPGIAPDLLTLALVASTRRSRACAAFAAITAGGELHPALRTLATDRNAHFIKNHPYIGRNTDSFEIKGNYTRSMSFFAVHF